MKITFLPILFLLPFLCLAQLEENEKDTNTELVFHKAASDSINDEIHEGKYILINGIEHWITIKGNRSKPIILFIHGGPGSVMSPYQDNIYKEWEKDFILVNWDQRGAGRTFGRNAPNEVDESYWIENKLTLDLMVSDGIELTRYLTKYLNKQKLILIGTSWGSILGAKMALTQPELYHAYLGNSQFVGFTENLNYAYDKVISLAEASGDTTTVKKLKQIGEPPYNSARSFGKMQRMVKKYEQMNVILAPASWQKIAPEYDNKIDKINRYNGDDYSFLYFAGHEKMGISSMVKDVNFKKDGFEFKIPVFLIQGEKDISTAAEISKAYFDKISAPDKAYYLIPEAGHGQNESVVNKEYEILKERLKY